VPLTLPGELVDIELSGGRGVVMCIAEASPDRADAPCPHFGACGGCNLQHWRDGAYAAWKTGTLAAALARAGYDGIPLPPIARTPPGARRRIDLAVRRDGPRVSVGLHGLRSNTVVDWQVCLVSHPKLVALLDPLRRVLNSLQALKREGSAICNLCDNGIDLLLRTDAALTSGDRARLAAFATASGVARVSWALGNGPPESAATLHPPEIALSGVAVQPGPGAFLQASPQGEAAIVAAVRAGLPAKGRVADLYAGYGTITHAIALTHRVAAYEGDAAAAASLKRAGIAVEHRDLVRRPLLGKELKSFAAVVLDPPFGGAATQLGELASAKVPRIIYVSCNPAALARDARILRDAGYQVLAATPIDQFLWSARLESVIVFDLPKRGKS